MAFINFLYATTIWKLGLVVSGIFVGSTVAALVLMNRLWSVEHRSTHNNIAGFLISIVGVIFAILVSSLAIQVMSRQDKGDSLVREEAQLLETIYREADLAPPDQRNRLRQDVRSYLDAVIDGEWPQMRAGLPPTKAAHSWNKLWRDVVTMPVTNFAELLTVQSLRQNVDKLATTRRGESVIATTGVDVVVWAVVLLGSTSTILFAVFFGVRNFVVHVVMTSMVAFTMSLAIIMIIALDWPYYGSGSVGPDALVDLRQSLDNMVAPPT